MKFRLDRVPPEGLGLYPIVGSDNYRLSVNGSLIYGEGRMDVRHPTYHGNVRRVFRLPSGVLNAGDNEIEFVLVRHPATAHFFVAPPLIGDYTALRTSMAGRLFWLNTWFEFSITVGITIASLALVVLWRSARRTEVLWAFLLVSAWTAKLFYYDWVDPPISGDLRLFFLYALVNFIPVAWFNLANATNAGFRRWSTGLSLIAYGAVVAATGAIMLWRLGDGAETIDLIGMIFSAAMAVLAMGVFVYSLLKGRGGHIVQHAFFFLCLSLIVADSTAQVAQAGFGDNVNTRRTPNMPV